MKLSEMRRILDARGIQLTKSLGQNFLHDPQQLRRIADLAELQPTDRVLEIGPGLGPLTEVILARAGEVLAIEKDARLVTVLRERLGTEPRLTLLHDDALVYLERTPCDWSGWKLVANLPYSVASTILVELAETAQCPGRLVFTLQHEVARRLASGPGGKDYGILALLVQLRYELTATVRIPADCFFPAPEVESSVVCLRRRLQESLSEGERRVYRRVVKRAFSERRKKALKLLRFDWPREPLDEAWRKLGLSELIRAEMISREQFIELARHLTPFGQAPAANPPPAIVMSDELFDVVNEQDEVVEQRPRREVHQHGLRHRAVHVLVFNHRGELFLQKRSMKKDCFPGTWDSSASGHLAPGESYDAAAVRELNEELGWTPTQPLQRLFKIDACAATGQEFVWIYRVEGEGPFHLHPEEIETGGWFTLDRLEQWLGERPGDFAGSVALIWKRLRESQAIGGPVSDA